MSLFADDMHILLYKKGNDFTKTLLKVINKSREVAGYKINRQKSFVFLYTCNKLSLGGTTKTIPFAMTSQRIKYLGMNLTKEVKDLCTVNYNALMKKKLRKIQINGCGCEEFVDVCFCGWEELKLAKCLYCLKQSTVSK